LTQLELQVITAPSLIFTFHNPLLQTLSLLQPTMSSTAISCQQMLTMEILQLPMLRSFLSSEYIATELPQFHSAGLGSSLYSLEPDPTENTVFNNHSVVVDACLPVRWLEMGCITVVLFLCVCARARARARVRACVRVGRALPNNI
jgi:hypothetical protein